MPSRCHDTANTILLDAEGRFPHWVSRCCGHSSSPFSTCCEVLFLRQRCSSHSPMRLVASAWLWSPGLREERTTDLLNTHYQQTLRLWIARQSAPRLQC